MGMDKMFGKAKFGHSYGAGTKAPQCPTCAQPLPAIVLKAGDVVEHRYSGAIAGVEENIDGNRISVLYLTGARRGDLAIAFARNLQVVHGHFHITSRGR